MPDALRVPRQHRRSERSSSSLRGVLFAALAIAIVGAAIWFVRPKELAVVEATPSGDPMHASGPIRGADTPADLSVRIDMAGFAPADVRIPAGTAVRLKLVNPDTAFHTDGGGIHGFTAAGLGIDVKVPPQTAMIVTLPALSAGDYTFYCDTCCGGKENPSMNGVLRVRA